MLRVKCIMIMHYIDVPTIVVNCSRGVLQGAIGHSFISNEHMSLASMAAADSSRVSISFSKLISTNITF